MADCSCLSGCPFFNDKMANMPSTANMYKKKYCQGDYSACARYMIFSKMGKDKVPANLFPNQTDRARAVLAG